MRFAKLKLSAAIVSAAVGLAGAGAVMVGAAPQPPEPKPAAAKPAVVKKPFADARQRATSLNNLKLILLGLHNYHDVHGHLPVDILSRDGKPLLSWRVALLPYIEQEALYKSFKLDEPWDSPANKQAVSVVVRTFATGREPAGQEYPVTFYQRPTGKGLGFEPGQKLRFLDFTDGLSNTLAVVEAETPVPWAKPGDFGYDPDKPADVFGPFVNVTHFAWLDGSVGTVVGGLSKGSAAAFTRAGGEVLVLPLQGAGLPPGVQANSDDAAVVRKELADATAELDRLLAENRTLHLDRIRARTRPGQEAELLIELDQLLADAKRVNERLKSMPADKK